MVYSPLTWEDKPARTTPVSSERLRHMETQYAEAVDYINELGAMQTAAGRKVRAVGCAIRNTGSGFTYIDDATHERLGFTTISQTATDVVLDYGFTASRVITLLVGSDETYAERGIVAGASVGLSSANIRFGTPAGFNDYVQYDGSAWTSTTGFITSVTMNGTTGLISFNHAAIAEQYGGSVVVRSANLRVSNEGRAADTIGAMVFPYNSATSAKTPTTDMKFWINRPGVRKINPATLTEPSGNFWVVGLMEVGND